MRLLDLSHVIEHQMSTYPGLPGPEISDHLSFDASTAVYDAGTEFAIGRISMVANTGTYLDTPAHRFRAGHDLSGLTLERCASLPTVVVDVTARSVPTRSMTLPSKAAPYCCEPAGIATGARTVTATPFILT